MRQDVLYCMLSLKKSPYAFDLAVSYFDEFLRIFLENDGRLLVPVSPSGKLQRGNEVSEGSPGDGINKEKYEFRLIGLTCLRLASSVLKIDERQTLIDVDKCIRSVFYDVTTHSDPSTTAKLKRIITYDCYANIEKEILYALNGNLIRATTIFFVRAMTRDKNISESAIENLENFCKLCCFWKDYPIYKPFAIAVAVCKLFPPGTEFRSETNGLGFKLFENSQLSEKFGTFSTTFESLTKIKSATKLFKSYFGEIVPTALDFNVNLKNDPVTTRVDIKNVDIKNVDVRYCSYDIVRPLSKSKDRFTRINKISAVTIDKKLCSRGIFALKTNLYFYDYINELSCLSLLRDEPHVVNIYTFFLKKVRLSNGNERPDLKTLYDCGFDINGVSVSGVCLDYGQCTLKTLLETDRLDRKKLKLYFRDIVLGVKACHDFDIIHRDLKPDNIIWIPSDTDGGENGRFKEPSALAAGENGRFKEPSALAAGENGRFKEPSVLAAGENGRFVLIDFDISVSYSSFATWLDPTMASCAIFRAPEALFLSNKYNKKIDIWSLGNIFYLMVTGRYICENCDSMEEIIISIITMFGLPRVESWPDVYDLPFWDTPSGKRIRSFDFCKFQETYFRGKLGEYYDVIMKCLTMSPHDRADANELLKLL